MELGAPLGVVSYHVRMLRDYDCVELVRTEPRRGALQHFYRATARPNLDEHQWRTLPSGLRRELTGETIQELVNDLAQAADGGTLEDPEVVLYPHAAGTRRARLEEAQQAAREDARSGAGDRRGELRPASADDGLPDRAGDPALQARHHLERTEGPAVGRGPRRAERYWLSWPSCRWSDLDDHLRALLSACSNARHRDLALARPCGLPWSVGYLAATVNVAFD